MGFDPNQNVTGTTGATTGTAGTTGPGIGQPGHTDPNDPGGTGTGTTGAAAGNPWLQIANALLGSGQIAQVDVRTQFMKLLEQMAQGILTPLAQDPYAVAKQIGGVAGPVPGTTPFGQNNPMYGQFNQGAGLGNFLFGGGAGGSAGQPPLSGGGGGTGPPPVLPPFANAPSTGGIAPTNPMGPSAPSGGTLTGQVPSGPSPGVSPGTPFTGAMPSGVPNVGTLADFLRATNPNFSGFGPGAIDPRAYFGQNDPLSGPFQAAYGTGEDLYQQALKEPNIVLFLNQLLGGPQTPSQNPWVSGQDIISAWEAKTPYKRGIQGAAQGGQLDPKTATVVGERGPELIVGNQVIPLQNLQFRQAGGPLDPLQPITPGLPGGFAQGAPDLSGFQNWLATQGGGVGGGAGAGGAMPDPQNPQVQTQGWLQNLLGYNPETSAFNTGQGYVSNLLGTNPGKAIGDALQPIFQQNLQFGLGELRNSAPSVFNTGYGVQGSNLAQNAMNDYNLMVSQAMQEGVNQQTQGVGLLGQLAGQAGQNPFSRALGAGQLQSQRDLGFGQLAQNQQQFESQFGLEAQNQAYNQMVNPTLQLLMALLGMGSPTGYQTVTRS